MRDLFLLAGLASCLACGAVATSPEGSVGVEVAALERDAATNTPVLVLRESAGGRELSIWIGEAEARSIAMEIHGVRSPRPNSHDLARSLVIAGGGRVDYVVVHDLRDGIFLAQVVVATEAGQRRVDARPSDAIALALRSRAPIRIVPSVFVAAGDEPVFEVAPKDRQVPARSL